MSAKKRPQGFTLIEMLVVLVITSLTASLLVSGLESTWRNFEKLGARHLKTTAGQLPKIWFTQSVEGMVLRHPNTAMFSGSAAEVVFSTLQPPDSQTPGVYKLHWKINVDARGYYLAFRHEQDEDYSALGHFNNEAHFEYLTPQGWRRDYSPSDGRIPRAIRINENDGEWVMALPTRPVRAETPPEMQAFGKYEF